MGRARARKAADDAIRYAGALRKPWVLMTRHEQLVEASWPGGRYTKTQMFKGKAPEGLRDPVDHVCDHCLKESRVREFIELTTAPDTLEIKVCPDCWSLFH